jgi:hypothetical protein
MRKKGRKSVKPSEQVEEVQKGRGGGGGICLWRGVLIYLFRDVANGVHIVLFISSKHCSLRGEMEGNMPERNSEGHIISVVSTQVKAYISVDSVYLCLMINVVY